MQENYEGLREQAKAELEFHHSKLQDKPFSNRAKTIGKFNTDKAVYGLDQPMPELNRTADPRWAAKHAEHGKPFRPSHPPRADQISKSIGRFPGWVGEPPKEITKKEPADPDAPKKFKPTHNSKTVPCTSVVANLRNLRAAYPSVLRK